MCIYIYIHIDFHVCGILQMVADLFLVSGFDVSQGFLRGSVFVLYCRTVKIRYITLQQ